MRPSRFTVLAALAVLAACHLDDGPVAPRGASLPRGPAAALSLPQSSLFIVAFQDSVSDPASLAAQIVATYNVPLAFVYAHAIKGFAAALPAAAIPIVERLPFVRRVEADGPIQALDTQTGATWGLDRVDQRALPLSGTYTFNNTGAGVTAYIVDTGIRFDHTEFWTSTSDPTTRAVFGVDEIGDGQNGLDCHGHGTHVSGTVGGLTYGLAKAVRLVAVRVLGCGGSGAWAGFIAGVDWMVADHQANELAVANASLGGGFIQSANDAVARAVQDGIVFAVAAGNSNADACSFSPSSTPEAITVGATDQSDTRASFSNFGTCVDWFAPGVGITSSWNTSTTATNTISGTSMASPHTAGAAALFLAAYPTYTPAGVRDSLYVMSTKNIVTSANSANNHLLYTLDIGSAGPPPPPPPPPAITLTATQSTRGALRAFLSWTTTPAANIDVYRNGAIIATVTNSGSYTDNLHKAAGTYVYQVCEAGATTTCSNTVTVTF